MSTVMSISKINSLVSILVKFKLLQSCQVNFNLFSSIQFVSVNGQVASSRPRTACACQFTLVIGQVASSHPRTACTCQICPRVSPVSLVICYFVNVNQSRNGYDIFSFVILLMSTSPAMDTTYFVKFNSQSVLHS